MSVCVIAIVAATMAVTAPTVPMTAMMPGTWITSGLSRASR